MESSAEHLNVMFSPIYAVPVFGFVVPPLAIVVLLVNFLMVWTLRRRDLQSPVNTVLICIAVSDTLTIILPSVPFVYFYTLGNYKDFIPFSWCRAFFNLVHIFPMMCNMASLWSTVALATIRCYSVWRPLHVKSTITTFRTRVVIVFIYMFSAFVYAPILFEYTYTPLSAPSMTTPNATIMSCHMQKSQSHVMQNFCAAHTWIQIILTSLLPWFLITFPDAGLLWKLRQAESERKSLNDCQAIEANNTERENQEKSVFLNKKLVKQRRMTTWLIFLVVSMVWIVEIPFAVSFTKYLAHTKGDVMRNPLGDNVVFVLLLKYITYPVIFVIYCFMSQRFRKAFRESVCCCLAISVISGSLQDSSSKRTTSTSRDYRDSINGCDVPLTRPSSTSA